MFFVQLLTGLNMLVGRQNKLDGGGAVARKTKEEAEKTRKDIVEAARRVFHRCGVSRSSLDRIAKEAGVTRGAVYWHFKDKAELFFAMREEFFMPLVARGDELLFSSEFANPLDAIEAAVKEFFRLFLENEMLREVFEIMALRCEYVDEFSSVQQEVGRPVFEFLEKMKCLYQQASEKGCLRGGFEPLAVARDTWAFCTGLLHLLLSQPPGSDLAQHIPAMIEAHMRLRRIG